MINCMDAGKLSDYCIEQFCLDVPGMTEQKNILRQHGILSVVVKYLDRNKLWQSDCSDCEGLLIWVERGIEENHD